MMGCVDGSYSRFGIFTDIERNAPESEGDCPRWDPPVQCEGKVPSLRQNENC